MLPASGQISHADINSELGVATNSQIGLNDTLLRLIAGKQSGSQISESDFYNKSFPIANSLRFRQTGYLSRTIGTPTNSALWTVSFWVKKGTNGATTTNQLFAAYNGNASIYTYCYFYADDTLRISRTSTDYHAYSNDKFSDISSWYHIVISWDTSGPIRMYKNGIEVSYGLQDGAGTYLSSWNTSGATAAIGAAYNGTGPFDGYMTEFYMVDGQALTPSSFGQTNTSTGQWLPKAYTGTYGNNGFYLKFSDIGLTSGSNSGLGKDFSGNGNYWNTNNIILTGTGSTGWTYDATIDVPWVTNNGGYLPPGNFATLNSLQTTGLSYTPVIFGGGINMARPNGPIQIQSTIGVKSGKWYAEFYSFGVGGIYNNLAVFGISKETSNLNQYAGYDSKGWGYIPYYAYIMNNNAAVTSALTGSSGSGDSGIIQIALDMDNGRCWWGKDGTWLTGSPSSATSPTITGITNDESMFFSLGGQGGGDYGYCWANFGQRPFVYTPPTGYSTLCTTNLPTPVIPKPNQHFDVTLYTGTGAGRSITNAGLFQPDLVWIKSRSSAAYNHRWFDSIRGAGYAITSADSMAQFTEANALTSFDSTGFSLGADTGGGVNTSGASYAAWQWKGSGTTVTNTSGSITSTVCVNTTAGFSIVRYTGNQTAGATVGHGLGVAPKMVIAKGYGGVTSWPVYHASCPPAATPQNTWTLLNSNNTGVTSAQEWNNTAPTSTVFSIGNSSANDNQAMSTIAYCFAEIEGYSKFGSYIGTGSETATCPIYCGFRPRFIMIKNESAAFGGDWVMYDTARDTYNDGGKTLYPNGSTTENDNRTPYSAFKIFANGFKPKGIYYAYTVGSGESAYTAYAGSGNYYETNVSGYTYIYAAFADLPFKYTNAF